MKKKIVVKLGLLVVVMSLFASCKKEDEKFVPKETPVVFTHKAQSRDFAIGDKVRSISAENSSPIIYNEDILVVGEKWVKCTLNIHDKSMIHVEVLENTTEENRTLVVKINRTSSYEFLEIVQAAGERKW